MSLEYLKCIRNQEMIKDSGDHIKELSVSHPLVKKWGNLSIRKNKDKVKTLNIEICEFIIDYA